MCADEAFDARMIDAHRRCRKQMAFACLCALLGACANTATRAGNLVVCADLADSNLTRATYAQDATGRLTHFDIVTPDTLWPAPGQPETPRFAAGESDVSPNLANHPGVRVDLLSDTGGALRIIDFASRTPDAIAIEALRGSLVMHEAFVVMHEAFDQRRAVGSLYITAGGTRVSVTTVMCRRFSSAGR